MRRGRASGGGGGRRDFHRSGPIRAAPSAIRASCPSKPRAGIGRRPRTRRKVRQRARGSGSRRTDRCHLPEDESEQSAGGRDDDAVDGGGENAPSQGRTLQRDIDARTFLHFRLPGRLDRDSAQELEAAGTISGASRMRGRSRSRTGSANSSSGAARRSPGARELDDLSCDRGCDRACDRALGSGRGRGSDGCGLCRGSRFSRGRRHRRWNLDSIERRCRRTHPGPELDSKLWRISAEKVGSRRECHLRCERDPLRRNSAAATDSGVGVACAGLDNDSAERRLPAASRGESSGADWSLSPVSGCRAFRRRMPARRLALEVPPVRQVAGPRPGVRRRRLASAAKRRNARRKSSGRCHHKADKA